MLQQQVKKIKATVYTHMTQQASTVSLKAGVYVTEILQALPFATNLFYLY